MKSERPFEQVVLPGTEVDGGPAADNASGYQNKRAWTIGIAAVAGLIAFIGLTGADSSQKTEAAPSASDVPVQDGDLIRFNDGFAKRAKVTMTKATFETMSPLVRATGTVTFEPKTFAAVGARITGRVFRVYKIVGDRVTAGEPLAEVESAELGRAEAHLTASRAKERAAEAQYKRERRLAEARITSARDAEVAQAAFESAQAERVAAEQAVRALGGQSEGRLGVLVLRSPMAGRVVSSKLARGQTVQPSDTLYEIADLGTLWVELAVFERDVGQVRERDRVRLVPQAAGGHQLEGRVAHVGDVIDPEARTATVRVVVDNASGSLRPGQSVTAHIETTAPAAKSVTIPLKAVTRVDGKPTVFLMVDENTVRLRPVTTGTEDATRVAIVEGLAENDRVLVGGVFALRSELFR